MLRAGIKMNQPIAVDCLVVSDSAPSAKPYSLPAVSVSLFACGSSAGNRCHCETGRPEGGVATASRPPCSIWCR